MVTTGVGPARDSGYSIRLWMGSLFLVVGFLGHYLAARAIGGTYIAYRDHMGGFVFLTIVTGVVIAGLGLRFWRGRHDVTLLILGVRQAAIGVFVSLNR